MPTYEYACEKCGKFEFKQRITEDALNTCPTCGSEVKRLISKGVGVMYKGSGFYTTDSKKSEAPACKEAGGGCGNVCAKSS